MRTILLIIYVGLLFELMVGWSQKPNKKFYRQLFNLKIYFFTLFGSILLLLVPIYYFVYKNQVRHEYLAIPFFYLILFKIINAVSHLINNRNIIIAGKGDQFPKEHKWYIDSILAFLAMAVAIILPILISNYFFK